VSTTPEQIAERLEKALLNIASNSPDKEPRNYSTVGAPRNWSEEARELIDQIAEEAFDQGHARACWELGQIADAALKPAP
jgi:hypothetical protein